MKDVLADMGIGAKEGEYLLKRTVENIVRSLASAKIIESSAVEKTVGAMEGKLGGLNVATAKASREGVPKFSCPKGAFLIRGVAANAGPVRAA